MTYGIKYTVEVYHVYEDGRKEKQDKVDKGWQLNEYYTSLKAAKFSLSLVKDMLKDCFYDVHEVNGLTVRGFREWVITGTGYPKIKAQEFVTYHIEPRKFFPNK